MRIDRNERIANCNILSIRDALRHGRCFEFTTQLFENRLGVRAHEAMAIALELQELGYIETAYTPGYFELTIEGNALTNARAVPPLPRAKAEQMLAAFLERVRAINANPDLTHDVLVVHLFGSLLGEGPNVGDLDLAIELRARGTGKETVERSRQRAAASGKVLSYCAELTYGETEVRRLLRARSPYISLHGTEDLTSLTIAHKTIYRLPEEEEIQFTETASEAKAIWEKGRTP